MVDTREQAICVSIDIGDLIALTKLIEEAPTYFSPQHDFDGDKLKWLERSSVLLKRIS